MVGSCATRSREPGQGRKAAAVSGVPGAPRECPAGAGSRNSNGGLRVQDGARGPLSFEWVASVAVVEPLPTFDLARSCRVAFSWARVARSNVSYGRAPSSPPTIFPRDLVRASETVAALECLVRKGSILATDNLPARSRSGVGKPRSLECLVFASNSAGLWGRVTRMG